MPCTRNWIIGMRGVLCGHRAKVEESLSRRQAIQHGLELGRYLFSRLYVDLDALNPALADE